MNGHPNPQQEAIENEIEKDKLKMPISNSEASFFMHSAYREMREEMELEEIDEPINPVFTQFLEYFQQFEHLKYGEDLENKDLKDALSHKKSSLKSMREEIEATKELKNYEAVLLMNLRPSNIEEAVTWVPGLKRLISKGKKKELMQIIEIINKYSTVDFNN